MNTMPDFTQFRLCDVDAAILEHLKLQEQSEAATLDQLCRLYGV